MDAGHLKSLQAPLKARYRETPNAAVITLKARKRDSIAVATDAVRDRCRDKTAPHAWL